MSHSDNGNKNRDKKGKDYVKNIRNKSVREKPKYSESYPSQNSIYSQHTGNYLIIDFYGRESLNHNNFHK